MNKVLFFNKLSQKLAALRESPTLQNLITLAKEDPIQAFEEINDFADSIPMTMHESNLWLVGYISGLCAAKVEPLKESLTEVEGRVKEASKTANGVGKGQYRRPYRATPKPPVKGKQSGPDDDGPRYA